MNINKVTSYTIPIGNSTRNYTFKTFKNKHTFITRQYKNSQNELPIFYGMMLIKFTKK